MPAIIAAIVRGKHANFGTQFIQLNAQHIFLALWQQWKSSSIVLQQKLQQHKQSSSTWPLDLCTSLFAVHSYSHVHGQNTQMQSVA